MNKQYFKVWWLLLPALLMGLSACERSNADNPVLPNVSEAKAPVLRLVNQAQSDIVIALDRPGELEFTWDNAEYGTQIPLDYTLTATVNEQSISFPITRGEKKISIPLIEFNERVIKTLGLTAGEKGSIDFTLSATPQLESGSPVLKDAVVTSQPLTINFTPAKPAEPEYPEAVYMIGQEFGGWNWDSEGVVEMTPIHSLPGKFWAIRYFADPANRFKWNTEKKWGGDFATLGTEVGYTVDGSDALVAQSGIYLVLVDFTAKTITIEPAQVFGIGDAFGSWEAGKYPFKAVNGKMTATTAADGNLRIYASSEAAGIGGDWWRMEFVIFDGKIAYRGNGGDQPAAPVTAGQVITLDFNAGTGTIK